MIRIGRIENPILVTIIFLFITLIIGYADFITVEELSLSIFYIIPIAVLALYKEIKVTPVIICSVVAAILCFIVEFHFRQFSNVLFPIWNSLVRLAFFAAIGLLLHYLKEKDKRLKVINQNLHNLNEEKNKYVGMAAHDLRSPVSGIYAITDIVLNRNKNNLDPKSIDMLSMIRSMSEKTLKVLQDLLDVSKIEAGKVELNKISQDYLVFIKKQIALSDILARDKNILITLQSTEEQIIMCFDSQYLSEVIDNLLSNAIKYSFSDSEIKVKITIPEKGKVLTEVIDQGKGIPANEQQKLFNYFHTTSTRPTNGEKSTGLGLAIAKKIVMMHFGEIGVYSNINEGSNFYFKLPV